MFEWKELMTVIAACIAELSPPNKKLSLVYRMSERGCRN